MINNRTQTKTKQAIFLSLLTLGLISFGAKTTFSQVLFIPGDNETCVSTEPVFSWDGTSGDATLEILDCNNIISGIGLANYTHEETFNLSAIITDDLSGITYNSLTNTLFAITNKGDVGSIYEAIYEVNLNGNIINMFNLIDGNETSDISNSFHDTEGIVHLYGRTFAVVEERKGKIAIIDLPVISGNIYYSDADIIQLPGIWNNSTNKGLEGITYDPIANQFHVVKESINKKYYIVDMPTTFPVNNPTIIEPYDLEVAPFTAISEAAAVHYVRLSSNFVGTDAADNRLIVDEAGQKIIEVNANYEIIDELPLPARAYEGITMDNNGTIYMAQEPNLIHVYTNPNPPEVIHSVTVSEQGYFMPPGILDEETEYCWRVINNQNTSATQSFTTIGTMTICTGISGGENDVEEWQDQTMSISSLDIELAHNPNPIKLQQKIGLRYEDLGIPRGAIIENAYLQFTTHAPSTGVVNLLIHGEDADNASPFTFENGNLSARPTTEQNVAWSPPDWNSVYERSTNQQTPDLKDILQEIVDRNSYDQNSAIAFIISGFGTMNRVAKSYESSPAFAPQLCVTFTPESCESICLKADIRLWLEGPYNPTDDTMRTGLNNYNILPAEDSSSDSTIATGQPYLLAPWNYPGTEGIGWEIDDYDDNIVDWVLVSFRTTPAASSEVFKVAALLHSNGSIHFIDECPLPDNLIGETLYIVVDHRNHMVVMSHEAVPVATNTTLDGDGHGYVTYDFKQQDSYHTSTNFGQKQLPNGEWVLFTGDLNGDYDINGADNGIRYGQNGIFGQYIEGDMNMNADVNGADTGLWSNNSGYTSGVPKN